MYFVEQPRQKLDMGAWGFSWTFNFSSENEVHPNVNRVPTCPVEARSADLASLLMKKRNLIEAQALVTGALLRCRSTTYWMERRRRLFGSTEHEPTNSSKGIYASKLGLLTSEERKPVRVQMYLRSTRRDRNGAAAAEDAGGAGGGGSDEIVTRRRINRRWGGGEKTELRVASIFHSKCLKNL
jgi:hypothetical protein